MNDLEEIGNHIEACLWFVVSIILAIKSLYSSGRMRQVFVTLCGAFCVFGISDMIEAVTGAWWQPAWLLIMKAGCIVVFFFGFREYYRIKRG